VALHQVRVTDPNAPNCDRRVGRLGAGRQLSYECSRPNAARSYTNVAGVVATSPRGEKVRDRSRAARVKVAPLKPSSPPRHHSIDVVLTGPKTLKVKKGGTAAFHVEIRYSDTFVLRTAKVTDPKSPSCDRTSVELLHLAGPGGGQALRYPCERTHVTDGFTNEVTVASAALGPDGGPLTDVADVTVFVPKPKPSPRVNPYR
jgi:hypothetical protein